MKDTLSEAQWVAINESLKDESPQEQYEALKALVAKYPEQVERFVDPDPLWRDDLVDGFGKSIARPPTFDEFVSSDAFMGQPGLYPRQEDFLRRGISFKPEKLFSRKKSIHTLVALWGKGCLGESEKITDVQSGITRTVKEWAEIGCPLTVLSWNGEKVVETQCSPVYKKGQAPLVKVLLADGKEFICTERHKCFAYGARFGQPGWHPIKDLRESDGIKITTGYPRIQSITPIGDGDFYDLTVPETHCYFDSQGILHHNSGKDFISSLVLSYVCFVINCMANPWAYLKHAPGEPIDIANIALNAEQANKVFFNKLKARLRRPCFGQFKPKINRQDISFYRELPGDVEPTLLLQCHSLHAQNDSWEGKSLICWVMDEADAFEDESGNSNADKCYLTLASSAGSRFGSRYLGLIISFRRVGDGFMDRMRDRSNESPEQFIYDEGATWEIRPDKSRTDPEIASHYKIDPVDAACKYENVAPPTVGGFFTLPERLDACCTASKPLVSAVEWESLITNSQTGQRQRFIALRLENWTDDQAAHDRVYFMHGDPGHTNASFAISVCHAEINRAVARGHDTGDDGEYAGDVLLNSMGQPMPNCRVVYYRDADLHTTMKQAGAQAIISAKPVTSTYTDREGRHAVWLTPGQYAYAFYDRHDKLIRQEHGLQVDAGVEMVVESPEYGGDVESAAQQKRMVFPVVEDLILEWRPRNGMPVDYGNVQDVILEICGRLNVYQVSFDKFNSVQLTQALMNKGINAIDVSFSNPVQMAMFRNLRQMVNAGLVSFLKGENETVPGRALYQMKRLRNRGNVKVEPPQGEFKDLADARAASVYYCCVHSEGLNIAQDDTNSMVWTPASLFGGNEAQRLVEEALRQFR